LTAQGEVFSFRGGVPPFILLRGAVPPLFSQSTFSFFVLRDTNLFLQKWGFLLCFRSVDYFLVAPVMVLIILFPGLKFFPFPSHCPEHRPLFVSPGPLWERDANLALFFFLWVLWLALLVRPQTAFLLWLFFKPNSF